MLGFEEEDAKGAKGGLDCATFAEVYSSPWGMALDDQSGTGWLGGPEGPLCTFISARPGELVLEIWLSWVDEAGRTTYEFQAAGSFTISQ